MRDKQGISVHVMRFPVVVFVKRCKVTVEAFRVTTCQVAKGCKHASKC